MSRIIKDISPTYVPVFDTVLQDDIYKAFQGLDRENAVAIIKWALLFSEHLYFPDTIIVDHMVMRELLTQKSFQPLLTETDLDNYPPLIVGLRTTCSTIEDVIKEMLSSRMIWSSLPQINRAMKKRSLTLEGFYSILGHDVKACFKKISGLLERSKGVIRIELQRGRYKNLVLDTCKNCPPLGGGYDDLIERFQEEVRVLPEEHFSRSKLSMIAEDIAYSIKRAELIPCFRHIFIDIPYNLNLSYCNGIATFGIRGVTGDILKSLHIKTESAIDINTRYQMFMFDLQKFKEERAKYFRLSLDRIQLRDIVNIRKMNSDEFWESIRSMKKAKSHEEFEESLRKHEELLCRELEKRKLLEPVEKPSFMRKIIENNLTTPLSTFASIGSLVWSYLSIIGAIPTSFLTSIPFNLMIDSASVTLSISSLLFSSRSARARRRAFLAGLNAVTV